MHFNKVGDTKINHHNESHVFCTKENKIETKINAKKEPENVLLTCLIWFLKKWMMIHDDTLCV